MIETLDAVERTSLLTAALRAAETRRPDRIYEDPYAAMLCGDVGPSLLAEMRAAIAPPSGTPRTLPSSPDYNAIRTRLFDDFLQEAARTEGMHQIVLAPAGMDSRAYRLDWPDGLRYFEIDRPAVLGYKQDRLADVTPRVDHRTVPVDLTSPTWEEDLLAAGYDPKAPSTWLLEGLLYYLTEADTHHVLRRVAAITAPGSRIAADMVNSAALTLTYLRPVLDLFSRWGCPWLFGTDEPEALFDRFGFSAEAVQPGQPGADFGRWPDPVPPAHERDVRRVFFVRGERR
ncbi:SAM-dependent methyltransferase [Streptomyces sp. N2-109]|uniref:S-adenosyl-L-methionine-dependent methyltransferase n=1 Tax=Streptomyces gossypii TaxID=2883101 RepID=A0ABT2JNC3_9ACTN|nr:SAM-dependent methyltransferase [Streptomyces gossypii]MCT2589321.1 SAM-dependent methyltransferase [Streptomyces gossypii]